MKSNIIDYSHPTSNIYGCQPCPKCKDAYRAAYKRKGILVIECVNCGHKENAVLADHEEAE